MPDVVLNKIDELARGPVPRCGDVVFHRPSRETWLVAYADAETDNMAWSGWPEGRARLADCRLIYPATDSEHRAHVGEWLDKGGHDHRVSAIRRLYPEAVRSLTDAEVPTHG